MLTEFITDIDSPSGYSSFARRFIKAFVYAGGKARITPRKHDRVTIKLDDWWKENLPHFLSNTEDPDVRINIETPEFYNPVPGVRNIAHVVWETDKLFTEPREGERPPDIPNYNWAKQMNRMDEIWTCSSEAGITFLDSGVETPIRMVNQPVAVDRVKGELPIVHVNVDEHGMELPPEKRPIVFGSIGQWIWRKNLDDLILAFCSEFQSHEAVLALKTYANAQNEQEGEKQVLRRVQQLKSIVGYKNLPKVILLTDTETDEGMLKLYNSFDIYVSSTRGEGFGIPIVQAMGLGIPTIATGWSAMEDYLIRGETGWPVDYTLEPAFGMPASPWYRPDQNWAKVNIIELRRTMREVWEGVRDGSEKVAEIAENGRKFVKKVYSPEAIGEDIMTALQSPIEREGQSLSPGELMKDDFQRQIQFRYRS